MYLQFLIDDGALCLHYIFLLAGRSRSDFCLVIYICPAPQFFVVRRCPPLATIHRRPPPSVAVHRRPPPSVTIYRRLRPPLAVASHRCLSITVSFV
ncbi:hypothetical protein LR48_Vigan04g087300 [Vigna angularis]|uniref:Uncharacterized protein n=1 Tax=Phaseolus angularis TaxID=3914 RepID=A0A0L9UCL9_PHAAN|nr:hypothetical protein LR48_Vigan04g087300 [Vigna angularis]